MRPVLMNPKASGPEISGWVGITMPPAVLPTGDTQHILTDLGKQTHGPYCANSGDIMSGAVRKMGQCDTVREAAGSPVPTPPQAGACTCSFCSAVQKLQLALVTAPLEGTTTLTL